MSLENTLKILCHKMLLLISMMMLYGGVGAGEDQIKGGFRFVSPASDKNERWLVEGDQAIFIDKEVMEISPVKATIGRAADTPMIVLMERARFNRRSKRVWTQSDVEILWGHSRLTGTGLQWNPAEKKVTILKDVKMTVDLEEAKGMKGF